MDAAGAAYLSGRLPLRLLSVRQESVRPFQAFEQLFTARALEEPLAGPSPGPRHHGTIDYGEVEQALLQRRGCGWHDPYPRAEPGTNPATPHGVPHLQVADTVVNMDQPWNPARLEQRIAEEERRLVESTDLNVKVIDPATHESMLRSAIPARTTIPNVVNCKKAKTAAITTGSGWRRRNTLMISCSTMARPKVTRIWSAWGRL